MRVFLYNQDERYTLVEAAKVYTEVRSWKPDNDNEYCPLCLIVCDQTGKEYIRPKKDIDDQYIKELLENGYVAFLDESFKEC